MTVRKYVCICLCMCVGMYVYMCLLKFWKKLKNSEFLKKIKESKKQKIKKILFFDPQHIISSLKFDR
jgi:hypothetical protein